MESCIDIVIILSLFGLVLTILAFLLLTVFDDSFFLFLIFVMVFLSFLSCTYFLVYAQEVPIENEALDSSTEVTVPEGDSLEEYKIDLMNEYLKDIRDSLVATSSDVQPLTDELDTIEGVPDLTEDIYDENLVANVTPASELSHSSFYSAGNNLTYTNVLKYKLLIDGTVYYCLFPPNIKDYLMVDKDGYLYNSSTSTVWGKLYRNTLDLNADNGMILHLDGALNNNYYSLRNNHSNNYIRTYSWRWYSGSYHLEQSDRYVHVKVQKMYQPFLVSDSLTIILIFLVGGGVFICLYNLYRHY